MQYLSRCIVNAFTLNIILSHVGANTYGGGRNEEVLVQECAVGPEYAIDTVSRDGVTKVLAVWKYTKVSYTIRYL